MRPYYVTSPTPYTARLLLPEVRREKYHNARLYCIPENGKSSPPIKLFIGGKCHQWIHKPILHCNANLLGLGPCIGLDPQCFNFALGIPTCWYLKMREFPLHLMPNLNLPPTRNPNASQWNIGCLGSQMQISRVGHVHLSFFMLISFALDSVFEWNMDYRRFQLRGENEVRYQHSVGLT